MITQGGWKRATAGWTYFDKGEFIVGTTGGALPTNSKFYVESKYGLPANINSDNSIQKV